MFKHIQCSPSNIPIGPNHESSTHNYRSYDVIGANALPRYIGKRAIKHRLTFSVNAPVEITRIRRNQFVIERLPRGSHNIAQSVKGAMAS